LQATCSSLYKTQPSKTESTTLRAQRLSRKPEAHTVTSHSPLMLHELFLNYLVRTFELLQTKFYFLLGRINLGLCVPTTYMPIGGISLTRVHTIKRQETQGPSTRVTERPGNQHLVEENGDVSSYSCFTVSAAIHWTSPIP
jgi:hypothetical protein